MKSKELEKHLAKMKKDYGITSSTLSSALEQMEKFKKIVEDSESLKSEIVSEMKKLHNILKNMDFAGALDVKIGNDEDDVAYAVDGKYYSYNENDNALTKYERSKKEEPPTDFLNLDDVDIDDTDFTTMHEGIDVGGVD